MTGREKQLILAGLLIFALVYFFLVPVYNYSGDAATLGVVSGGGAAFTAQVSPSYALLGCGEVYSPMVRIITYPGFSPVYGPPQQLYSGGDWKCK